MEVTVTEEQRKEILRSLMCRRDQLNKVKKQCEDAGLGTAEPDYHLRLITGGPAEQPGLVDIFDDNTHIGDRSGELPFEGNESQPVDEALDGIEKEAAERIRQVEIRRAVRNVLSLIELDDEEKVQSDEDLVLLLTEIVADGLSEDNVPVDSEEYPDGLPGFWLHTTAAGARVVCARRGYNDSEEDITPALAFWYDVDPATFKETDVAPTLEGEALLAVARETLGIKRPGEITETPEEYRARIRPAATDKKGTTLTLQALHTMLFRKTGADARWLERKRTGLDEDQLYTALQAEIEGTTPETWSEPYNMGGDGPTEFASFSARPDLEDARMLWKGQRPTGKAALTADEFQDAARDLLEIPFPEPTAESVEAAHANADAVADLVDAVEADEAELAGAGVEG